MILTYFVILNDIYIQNLTDINSFFIVNKVHLGKLLGPKIWEKGVEYNT